MSRVIPFHHRPAASRQPDLFESEVSASDHQPAPERPPGSSFINILEEDVVPLPLGEIEIETPTRRRLIESQKSRFLLGPLPVPHIAAAHRAVGSSDTLPVWLMVIHRCDLSRTDTVTLPLSALRPFGISRRSRDRALQALQGIGMLRVDVATGRAARITLLVGRQRSMHAARC
jgi:hypothetical protein